MQLFTALVTHPIEFGIAIAVVVLMLGTVGKAFVSSEETKPGWVRTITTSNARIFFALRFIVWALVFGIGLQLVPHEGASSPYGGLALIALFSGFFIMMGFLWAVIGE